MKKLYYSDDNITNILDRPKPSQWSALAPIGPSQPPRYEISTRQSLQGHSVNPVAAGSVLLRETVYASLAKIPVRVDMVDIFRIQMQLVLYRRGDLAR